MNQQEKEVKTKIITKALGMGDVFRELDIYYEYLEKEKPGARAEYKKWLAELADTKLISSFS